ncbi:hypothetical protein CYY_007609 [Polysphondylium violaceum]|uniref:Peptidase S28 family protein n=1 Tax=Polysphondylium violaceum TaxID=133409 RepID=A0A8J4V231_9MYCE|nr:hypothetical protein CYY_007609 [Polysphondylium violaceum]
MMKLKTLSIVLFGILLVSLAVEAQKRGFNPHIDLRKGLRPDPELLKVHDYTPQYQWFTQRLDHFNVANTQTFQQRYIINDQYWNGNGPVFMMINGEGPMGLDTVTSLQFVIWAKQYNALIISLEHRYYGASFATTDLGTDNLIYLNPEQALADNAVFRDWVNQAYNVKPTSKYVTFGGSYSGALSSWMRIKYPNLIDLAIASSGPVNPVVDFSQYLEVVQRAILTLPNLGNQCIENISYATQKIQDMLLQEDYSTLNQQFNLCPPLDGNPDDIATFMQALAGNWMGVAQYNNQEVGQQSLLNICEMMVEPGNDPLTNYITIWNLFANGQCTDVSYNTMIQSMMNTTNDATVIGGRMWFYQTCTNFGYYQTSDGPSDLQPFGDMFGLPYQVKQCADVFGFDFEPNVNWTITEFGGLNPSGSNVLYVNGMNDPWSALGLTEHSISDPLLPSLFIVGTSHCQDMMIPTAVTPSTVIPAQATINSFISKWLNQ